MGEIPPNEPVCDRSHHKQTLSCQSGHPSACGLSRQTGLTIGELQQQARTNHLQELSWVSRVQKAEEIPAEPKSPSPNSGTTSAGESTPCLKPLGSTNRATHFCMQILCYRASYRLLLRSPSESLQPLFYQFQLSFTEGKFITQQPKGGASSPFSLPTDNGDPDVLLQAPKLSHSQSTSASFLWIRGAKTHLLRAPMARWDDSSSCSLLLTSSGKTLYAKPPQCYRNEGWVLTQIAWKPPHETLQQTQQQTKLSPWACGFVFLTAVSHCVG